MHNFLQPALFPKVHSSSPCSEGYEASNLISANFRTKFRGFMAYYTLRPPVDVEFELVCPVTIRYIKICTRVEQQLSSAIEILIKDENGENASVSKSYFSGEGVIVCDSKFYSNLKPPCPVENYTLLFFKSYQHRMFTNADKITIRILQSNRSVPCLGNVEIWGSFAKSCSETTINSINKILNKSSNNSIGENNKTLLVELESICTDKSFIIPEEFKDGITFEIMALPMTLPSGSTIDKATLEKCIANDATYGRQPSDPFTGVPFTAFRKPALNVALKSRIDMFLVKYKNEGETHKLARTSGRKRSLVENNVEYACSAVKKCKVEPALSSISQERSLDDLIADAFKSNDFVRFTSDVAVNEDKTECIQCKTGDSLYSLPCKHLCCRCCLDNFCIVLKCKCGTSFIKRNVTKYHNAAII